jgi:hypothetical protein
LKKNIIYIFFAVLFLQFLSFTTASRLEAPLVNSVVVQFVTTNGFGNNLYIDNLTIGERPFHNLTLISINNIKKDTTYLPGLLSDTISPEVCIANFGTLGTIDSSTTKIYFVVGGYDYLDTIRINSLQPGQVRNFTFRKLTVYPNRPLDILVYADSVSDDFSHTNDSIRQNSVFLNGYQRNVLFEEFTSTTSPSCASNNPNFDNYINQYFDSASAICAIKYHLGFPIPGNDSMYLPDSAQLIQRSNYYFVNAVPKAVADGINQITLPFSYTPNLDSAYLMRKTIGSPLSIDVSDTRPGGDTIEASIELNLLYSLVPGDYRLRIMALERYIHYANPPGSNGETQFYDVCRQMFPDSAGIVINSTAGNYLYKYKYLRQPNWNDSMIYTVAFVQDDNTKEVINCGKARQNVFSKSFPKSYSSLPVIYRPDMNKNYNPVFYPHLSKSIKDTGIVVLKYELFEEPFPPANWHLDNPDKGISFKQVKGVNGISLGGSSCAKMSFYDYSNVGQKDTMTSIPFYDVTSEDSLKFDFAYATYLSGYADSLTVNLSVDGGATYTTIFQDGGMSLATSYATTLPFVPVNTFDWETFSYPMSAILPEFVKSPMISNYDLLPNYPNPFNPKTKIKYLVQGSSFVTIRIYDILGREIKLLVNQKLDKGIYFAEFDGSNFASGIYFCKMVAGNFVKVQRLALIK